MIAYVIFCNDGPEGICFTEGAANTELERLAQERFQLNKGNYHEPGQSYSCPAEVKYKYYRSVCYWHLHEVKVLEEVPHV